MTFGPKQLLDQNNRKRAYGLDPDTGKVVRFRAKIENYNRQFHKFTYEGYKIITELILVKGHINAQLVAKVSPSSHTHIAIFVFKYRGNKYKYATGLEKHLKEGKGCSVQNMMMLFSKYIYYLILKYTCQ